MLPKRKFVFNTSGLIFCEIILDAVKDNCEVIVSPLVAAHIPSRKEFGYEIVALTEADKDYVYRMIRRCLGKELATDYRRGRRTSHAGEFESIALAKCLEIQVVIHDNRARKWAKWEKVESLHPIELPGTFHRKLKREKLIDFLKFHCRMRYESACEELRKL